MVMSLTQAKMPFMQSAHSRHKSNCPALGCNLCPPFPKVGNAVEYGKRRIVHDLITLLKRSRCQSPVWPPFLRLRRNCTSCALPWTWIKARKLNLAARCDPSLRHCKTSPHGLSYLVPYDHRTQLVSFVDQPRVKAGSKLKKPEAALLLASIGPCDFSAWQACRGVETGGRQPFPLWSLFRGGRLSLPSLSFHPPHCSPFYAEPTVLTRGSRLSQHHNDPCL
jgi:hypothetical protein